MRTDHQPFKRQIALVTGVPGPLASALARGLSDQGAKVYAVGEPGPDLDELAGASLIPLALDVTSRPAFVRIVDEINAREGRIDLLVNATNLTILGQAGELTEEDWAQVLDNNVMGTVNAIELIYPAMVERRSGHIVNIGSLASDIPETCAAPFAASKAFMLGLIRSIAPEAAQFGVTLTLALPGFISPDHYELKHVTGAKRQEAIDAHTRCPGTADEIAKVIIGGISRKELRVFYPPVRGRLLWCLSHWFPFVLLPIQRRFLKPFRNP